MAREKIKKLIGKVLKNLYGNKAEVKVERPAEAVFGDYSTNAAMVLKKNPREITDNIKSPILEKIEARNGFINFFLSKKYLQRQIGEILNRGGKFGELKIGRGKKIQVEFISANPTGPLTLGNGRGGFCGDVLSNVLKKAGFKVKREYYINDTGEQIRKLGHSVIGDSEAVYKGDYINDLRKRIKIIGKNPEKIGEEASRIILKEMIKPSIKKMGIKFDVWFSEKSLRKNKETDRILNYLKNKKLAYEKEGALWFASSQFGDDKDRVLVKADGEKTYIASDAAYLKNKINRGFDKLIYILGADHYGYMARIKAVAQALGYKKEKVEIIIMQLVRLFEKGQEVRMSKRSGVYVALDELINEVGLDAARFFFLEKAADTHLDFNLDLAKERSEKNPVYYVQYAYARICSILRKAKNYNLKTASYKLLNHPGELKLIKQLIRLHEIVEDTAEDFQVQRLLQYATDLAAAFHQFYRDCRVLTENTSLSKNRLALVSATKIVLKNTLDLMGVSAPKKM